MAYHVEKGTGDIVIDGFEKGIGDSPYVGLSDCRNMNLISTLGEAAVAFNTTLSSLASITTGVIASTNAGADTLTYTGTVGTPVAGMAVVFAALGGSSGLSAGTQSASADTNVYWIINVNTGASTFQVSTTPGGSAFNIAGNGTATFTTINMAQAIFNTSDVSTPSAAVPYVIDTNGRVWYYNGTTWVFTGNITRANGNGNGLVYYEASDGTGYIFAFRNHNIDYMPTATIGTWTYAWKTMNTANGTANSHHAIVGQDNVVYYCDGSWLGSFFQTAAGTAFDPSNAGTYTFSQKALALPYIETAQYLAELGVNLLVAGIRNFIYPWNRTATSFTYPILLSENFGYQNLTSLPKLLTVNTNTYIFTGNRGRIYITNGNQAQLYKKFPDFLTGTVDPNFNWGGVGYNKNQIYFGINSSSNGNVAVNSLGGLWAIDLDTKALRLSNQFSYGTYGGYCSLFIAIPGASAGFGFYAGWNDGSSNFGIDASSTNVYTGGQSYITSDLIPVGTFLRNTTFAQLEFKLSKPMVNAESVQLLMSSNLDGSFTSVGTSNTVGRFSDNFPITVQNMQWIQVQAITTGVNSVSSSFVRLKELRIVPQNK